MIDLAERECVPCRGNVPALTHEEIAPLHALLGGGWNVVDDHHLAKDFLFDDFRGALAFTNKVGAVAESQGHHPDIHLAWGKTGIAIWTHKVNGLTENDFILAARINKLQ
jgi:4a-hydroxytetrahydrobiopterin dehydratase